jgi:carboxyl-terminal processing protease
MLTPRHSPALSLASLTGRPWRSLLRTIACLGVATLTACSTAPKGRGSATAPPPKAAETFEAVWKTIDDQHFDRGDQGHASVDWAAIGAEFRPRVAEVRSDAEFRALLDAMLARLGHSHVGIIPGEVAPPLDGEAAAARDEHGDHAHEPGIHQTPSNEPDGHGTGDLGILFRRVDGAVMTLAPRPGGPADRAGLGAGWRVIAVDGTPLAPINEVDGHSDVGVPNAPGSMMRRFAAERLAATRVTADPGETVEITAVSPEGTERVFALSAESFGGEIAQFGNLPPLETHVTARTIASDEFGAAGVQGSPLPNKVAFMGFNIWMLPAAAELDRAIDTYRDADAIVLDLRGNPGGLGAMAMGIGGHFLNEPVSLGRMTNREGYLDFRVNPRRSTADGRSVRPFAGPLAILVDPLSASTSEIFAAGLQDLGRAVIIGQTSAGAALPSMAVRLPNGDVLQFAVADFVTPKGNRIEGHGVVPDIAVPLHADLLRREPDPALAAALRWIANQHRAVHSD